MGEESNASSRLQELFDHALGLPQSERSAYLRQACGDDDGLRVRLEKLLEAEGEMDAFLKDPTLDSDAVSDLESIGPYKVLQTLGEGGHGVVYLAEQRQPVSRRVALKVIKLGMDTKQVIARFEAERQALAMMDHPNIAKVFDAGATDTGRPYFVMELVRGAPITHYCDQCKLPAAGRLALFLDVCRAVQHAHQKGVIHRDLKPSNILVTLHDGVPVPKVIDFGIAKATNFRLTEKTLFTEFHQFVGTPAYTSPEQMEMSGLDVDTRSDIYSLGVLLYELLTGTTPVEAATFKRAAYVEIQRTIIEDEPPVPSTRVSTLARERQMEVATARGESASRLRQMLRGDLDWIVMKALEKDRERRYGSAQALAQDVQAFLNSEPVSAVKPSLWYRLRKFSQRHKAVAIIAATLLVGSVVSSWQAVRATRATGREQAARIEAQALAKRAQAGELAARRNLYVADMNRAQEAIETDVDRTIKLLEAHIPIADEEDLRGFEWRYLWGQVHRELFTLNPGEDTVTDLAISPDGKLLVSASREGVVRVWDLATKTQVHQFKLHGGSDLKQVAFSPDGNLLAAAGHQEGASHFVVVWNVNHGQEVQRFRAPSGLFGGLEFAVDGQLVVSALGSSGPPIVPHSLLYCDIATGEINLVPAHETNAGKRLGGILHVATAAPRAITSNAKDAMILWDTDSHKELARVEKPELHIFEVALSPDGRLAAGSGFFDVTPARSYVWDTHTWEEVARIDYMETSRGELFSPDGEILVISEWSGRLNLHQTKTWTKLTTYQQRGSKLMASTFSPDGELLVSSGSGGQIIGWSGKGDPGYGTLTVDSSVVAIRYSPDGKLLAIGMADGSVAVFDSSTKETAYTIPADVSLGEMTNEFIYNFFAFSPDSRQIAVAGRGDDPSADTGHHVDVWDTQNWSSIALPHSRQVTSVAWASNGMLATAIFKAGEGDHSVRVWDRELQEIVYAFPEGEVIYLCFSPDSRHLLSRSWNNLGSKVWNRDDHPLELQIWDLSTGPVSHSLVMKAGHFCSKFSRDGSLGATFGFDGKVRLYDTLNWQVAHEFICHTDEMCDLAFSPDMTRIATTGFDGWCKITEVDSGQELAAFRGRTVDFSPDGNTLAVGGSCKVPLGAYPESKSVRLYHARSLEEIDRERREDRHR